LDDKLGTCVNVSVSVSFNNNITTVDIHIVRTCRQSG